MIEKAVTHRHSTVLITSDYCNGCRKAGSVKESTKSRMTFATAAALLRSYSRHWRPDHSPADVGTRSQPSILHLETSFTQIFIFKTKFLRYITVLLKFCFRYECLSKTWREWLAKWPELTRPDDCGASKAKMTTMTRGTMWDVVRKKKRRC